MSYYGRKLLLGILGIYVSHMTMSYFIEKLYQFNYSVSISNTFLMCLPKTVLSMNIILFTLLWLHGLAASFAQYMDLFMHNFLKKDPTIFLQLKKQGWGYFLL